MFTCRAIYCIFRGEVGIIFVLRILPYKPLSRVAKGGGEGGYASPTPFFSNLVVTFPKVTFVRSEASLKLPIYNLQRTCFPLLVNRKVRKYLDFIEYYIIIQMRKNIFLGELSFLFILLKSKVVFIQMKFYPTVGILGIGTH